MRYPLDYFSNKPYLHQTISHQETTQELTSMLKNSLILFALIFCLSSCDKKAPNLKLSAYNHKFIIDDRNIVYKDSVVITNAGGRELKIENISTGCGCTSASVDKKTIKSKDKATLRFTYDPKNKSGNQDEYIIIKANTDSLVHILHIMAFIKD